MIEFSLKRLRKNVRSKLFTAHAESIKLIEVNHRKNSFIAPNAISHASNSFSEISHWIFSKQFTYLKYVVTGISNII